LDGEDIAAITGGGFPAVWCNVTFDPAMISESDSSNYTETTFESRK
jgi:hypothetical protein